MFERREEVKKVVPDKHSTPQPLCHPIWKYRPNLIKPQTDRCEQLSGLSSLPLLSSTESILMLYFVIDRRHSFVIGNTSKKISLLIFLFRYLQGFLNSETTNCRTLKRLIHIC